MRTLGIAIGVIIVAAAAFVLLREAGVDIVSDRPIYEIDLPGGGKRVIANIEGLEPTDVTYPGNANRQVVPQVVPGYGQGQPLPQGGQQYAASGVNINLTRMPAGLPPGAEVGTCDRAGTFTEVIDGVEYTIVCR